MSKTTDISSIEVDKAVRRINGLKHGEVFLVRDLFTEREWEVFKQPYIKGAIGILFAKAIENGRASSVTVVGKNKRGQTQYKNK